MPPQPLSVQCQRSTTADTAHSNASASSDDSLKLDADVPSANSNTGRYRPRLIPLFRNSAGLHYFPAVYLLVTAMLYAFIQSSYGEELHLYLCSLSVPGLERVFPGGGSGGPFLALLGFGTLLFVVSWHTNGALQAWMDSKLDDVDTTTGKQRWWFARYKMARLDHPQHTYTSILPNVLWNQLVVAPLLMIALYQFSWTFLGGRGYSIVYKRLPVWELVYHILLNYLVYDLLFYAGHRLLHSSPAWYRHHKLHHTTYGTIGVSGSYMSTVDFIVTQGLPIVLPPVVMGTHFSAMWFPLVIGGINSIHSHGAYAFPVSESV